MNPAKYRYFFALSNKRDFMKPIRILPILFLLVFGGIFSTHAQMLEPVTISHQVFKTGENAYDLVFTADIDPGWYMYSQHIERDDGPLPTHFIFEENDDVQWVGETEECGNGEVGYDEFFAMNLMKYSERAVFIQSVTSDNPNAVIVGYHEFMTCDNTRCLPPMPEDFEISLAEAIDGERVSYSQEVICEREISGYGSAPAPEETEDAQTETDKAPSSIGSINLGESDDTEIGSGGQSSGMVNPVQWSAEVVDEGDGVFTFIFDGLIEGEWAIYSHKMDPDDGPLPTEVFLFDGPHYEIHTPLDESGSNIFSGYDPFFEMEATKLMNDARYTISVRVLDESEEIAGFIEFMACDDIQCLSPIALDFSLDPATGEFVFDDGKSKDKDGIAGEQRSTLGEGTPVFYEFNHDGATFNCGEDTTTEKRDTSSFWWVFIFGFLGGLVAILTPCVFPMIPLTVSFFTKSSTDKAKGIKNAIIYGLSIIIIYVAMGLFITGMFGADALNLLATNAWFNIIFAILFIVFAISFFGYFELTLPSSWVNKTDSAADQGGLMGIFFMAFTLSLVSFSCTGPIIGTLLVATVTGGGPTLLGVVPVGPLVGMFGFSLALALPFALFAAFPGWLNSMPKSGGWMNSVKVSLGFVEIALALKFLSIADLTMGWKILPYEAFLALWIMCSMGLALYALGYIKFPHDSPVKKITATRGILASLMILVSIYFALGFRVSDQSQGFVTPNLLSGLAPPAGHSYIFPNTCPLNLNCFKDFQEGMKYAKSQNKPVLIDFTGHGCVNCRRMEDQVWSDDRIYNMINDDYVLISLYVDDRTPLDEPYTSAFSNRLMRNVGNQWADFQAIHFDRNAQPYYVLATPDGEVLNEPVGYMPYRDRYRAFLECGLDRFNEMARLGEAEDEEQTDSK